jgi:hypothetical protein
MSPASFLFARHPNNRRPLLATVRSGFDVESLIRHLAYFRHLPATLGDIDITEDFLPHYTMRFSSSGK